MALLYARSRLTSSDREQLYNHARGSNEFPTCPICTFDVVHVDRWEEASEPGSPFLIAEGVAHTACKRRRAASLSPRPAKVRRNRQKNIGAWRSRCPLPGGRDSGVSKRMDGRVVERQFAAPTELDAQLAAVAAEMVRP